MCLAILVQVIKAIYEYVQYKDLDFVPLLMWIFGCIFLAGCFLK